MKEKVLAATVAGGLLVGAAFVAAAVTTPGVAAAQEDSTTDSTEATDVRPNHDHGAILEDVLSDLVEDGTIDQSQADAILDAVQAKAEELKARAAELREQIAQFLEDGVITADELAELPEDHPFNNPDGIFAEALEDGELTLEEIQEARPHPRRDVFRRGAHFGALLDDGGIDQEEYDSLGEDHPLKQVDVSEYLEDGVITLDELREIWMSQKDSGDAA
ncbi:MAG: hypothetical protein DWQ40_10985 [Actinobacteria bacterium]|nr:MAG: hypothetical protein DWQ40_10985 [Actinomycetota bacterium]